MLLSRPLSSAFLSSHPSAYKEFKIVFWKNPYVEMEVYLPLCLKSEKSKQLKLVLGSESSVFASKECRIIENGNDLVCVCEGSSSFLYRFTGHELLSLGIFFFRRAGDKQLFSAFMDKEVKDFPEDSVASVPQSGSSDEVQLSADGEPSFVDFIGDTLVIGTKSGCLGAIFVNAYRTEIRGKVVRLQSNHSLRWCTSPSSACCVCVSTEEIFMIYVSPEHTDLVSYSGASGVNNLSSVAVHSISQQKPQSCFLSHADNYNLTVLRWSAADQKYHAGLFTLLLTEDDSASDGRCMQSSVYVHDVDNCSVLAVVYADAISFTSWDACATLTSSAAVKNELTASFGAAFWKPTNEGCRLYVLRSDAHCLLYDTIIDSDNSTIHEVVVAGQVTLPSMTACRLGGVESGNFLCWRSGAPLARNNALLQSSVDENTFEAIETRSTHNPSSSSTSTADAVLLLEVVPIRKSYGIVCLFSNGECHLSLYGERGTVRIAYEDHPHDATSCLAYEARESVYTCVLGFNDGDIRVFVEGQAHSWVRVAHCGVVDKLLWIPKMNETDDTLFVSISTEMGTVCFHAGENAAVSRIMSSPSRPLTSCLLDRELEYMFLFSDASSNLWHIPTCRLERAFRKHHGTLGRHFDNLFESHWASATKVFKFSFAGVQHYAVGVNVDLLLRIIDAGQQQRLQPSQEFISAISLILRCLGESCTAAVPTMDDFGEALEDVGLLVAPVQTQECVWCAMLMLCELLGRASDAVSAAAMLATIRSLNTKLLSYGANDPRRQADTMQQLLSRFYNLGYSTPASFRYALKLFISTCNISNVCSVIKTLMARSAIAPPTDQTAVENVTSGARNELQRERALSALLIMSSAATQRADYNIEDDPDLCSHLRVATGEVLHSLLASFQDNCVLLSQSVLLLGLVESYAVVRVVCDADSFGVFVDTLVREAFSGKNKEIKQASLEALERLVAHGPHEFLTKVIAPAFHSHTPYRPYVIVFLSHLVKNFPYESYGAFGAIAEILMDGLSQTIAGTKDESSIFAVSVSQLLRLSIGLLPNVSLQPGLNHLAVGRRDGKVVVYNIKTAALVTSFQAHQAPVLGVAYSGNIVTLDIATIAEPMNEIKIWRSANQTSSIASFFGGGSGAAFKVLSTVEVPAAGMSVADASLLIKYFHLSWLSPQCLEFSSPWHGTIQVALP